MKIQNSPYKYYLLISCLMLIFLRVSPINAQIFNLRNYTTDDGLPQSNANSVIQDSKGYIWIATQKGISRFDGLNFTSFSEKHGLVNNIARTLFIDSKKDLWIGTWGGLSKFENNSFHSYTAKDGLISNMVNYIWEDAKKMLWICTEAGISIYDGRNFKNVVIGKPDNGVKDLFEADDGTIWIASNDGVYLYKNEFLNKLSLGKELDKNITALRKGNNNQVWIGSTSGLYLLKDNQLTKIISKEGFPNVAVEHIMIDKKGIVWASTEKGVVIYDGTTCRRLSREDGLTNQALLCSYEDAEGNIWLGGRNGISVFNTNIPFLYYHQSDLITESYIFGMTQDKKGNYWFATYGNGILMYNGENYKRYTELNGLEDNRFFSVLEDHKGEFWFGTAGAGVLKFDGANFTNFNKTYNLPVYRTFNIFQDSKNTYWICTQEGGAISFDGTNFAHYNKQSGVDNTVLTVFEDKKGNIWFATASSGVIKYDGKKFTNYNKDYGLQPTFIRTISEDKQGNLWFGSATHGLFRIVEGNTEVYFQYLKESDGLNSDNIYNSLFDNQNNLWIGTEKGVDKVVFGNEYEIISIKHYTRAEGFIGEPTLNGSYEDKDGNIWFGTMNGVVRYVPSMDKTNTVEPKLNLRNIKLFFEETDWKKLSDSLDSENHNLPVSLELPPDKNHLTFEFIGICTTNPEKVTYQFRLEGFDKGWSPVTSRTEAVYSNIPPGNYIFHVKAANNDNVWTTNPISFSFIIRPPLYQEPWFISIIFILIGIVIAGVVRVRLRNLQESHRNLEEKIKKRTEQIQKQKEEILLHRDDIEKKNSILEKQNDEIIRQRDLLEQKNTEIGQKNLDITDSINYASHIQSAMLPDLRRIKESVSEVFIIYKPKDIVSGDFFWFSEHGTKLIFAVVDSTGHGVPGAFMSILGEGFFNQIINLRRIHDPAMILNELHKNLRQTLRQPSSENQDGMEVGICIIDSKARTFEFAGAKMPLIYIVDNQLNYLRGDTLPIAGIERTDEQIRFFSKHTFSLPNKPVAFYMFSDGFRDQFGGPKNKKFTLRRLKDILFKAHHQPMAEQQIILENCFFNWKGSEDQVDDILVMGFRIDLK